MKVNNQELLNKLIWSLAQGKDIPYLSLLLAQEISLPVMVTNEVNRILAFHDLSGTGPRVGDIFPVEVDTNVYMDGLGSDLSDVHFDERSFICQDVIIKYCSLRIQVNSNLFGNLIVFTGERKFEIAEKKSILSAVPVFSLALKNAWEKRKEHQQFQDEFIRDVIYNNYESKATIYDKARLWNWKFQGPFVVAVLEVNSERLRMARELGPQLFNRQIPIYASINNQMVIILSLDGLNRTKVRSNLNKFFAELNRLLTDAGIDTVKLGVGLAVQVVTDLYRSYQEAKIALELGKSFELGTLHYFEDIGFLKFVFTQPIQELRSFCQMVLGKVIAYDLEMNTELVATLSTYLESKCQITECAKRLYIHENTLRNRMKKIEELCEYDLRRTDHLVNVYIALRIYKLGFEITSNFFSNY